MTSILVIGCGIVGPVVSLLLKKKGYHPVIVEKVKQHGDAGLSLGMFPNGCVLYFFSNTLTLIYFSLKVLATLAPELAEPIIPWREGAEYTSAGEYLGTFDQSYFKKEYGFSSFSIRRSELQRRLRDEATRQGITIHQDWELETLQETAEGIIATSRDGRTISASVAIGCDGLHSKTRRYVLEKHDVSELQADNTGLVMVCKARLSHSS